MKITVVYYSKSGNTEKMAQVIVDSINQVEGAEAKAFSVDQVDMDYLEESKCIIVGTPAYVASMAAPVKTWIDSMIPKGKLLKGKMVGGFATADYYHGGGDVAILSIFGQLMSFGMLPYSGGGSQGAPVIHLGPVAFKGKLEEFNDLFTIYGQRMAGKALELFGEK